MDFELYQTFEDQLYYHTIALLNRLQSCSEDNTKELLSILDTAKYLIHAIRNEQSISKRTCRLYEKIKSIQNNPKFYNLKVFAQMKKHKYNTISCDSF